MVVDASALLAILFGDQGAERLADAILATSHRMVAAPTLVEAGVVAEARRGAAAGSALDRLVARLELEICPCTEAHAGVAREAWRRFGKGRHAAALNFGDLFSYALAVERREPLLFTGEDFAKTDVELVNW